MDSITVQGRKDREKIQLEVNQFVAWAMVHHWDEPLMRWNTPVCPLVAGLPRDQGEFVLRRLSGTNSPSAAGTDWPAARLPNSRLSNSAAKSIYTAVITVDLPRMKGVNLGRISDYVAMVGLAEINMDREIITAPSVLRLFSEEGNAPADGMSLWDQALLKALYASRATDVMQISEMKAQMVNSIARH